MEVSDKQTKKHFKKYVENVVDNQRKAKLVRKAGDMSTLDDPYSFANSQALGSADSSSKRMKSSTLDLRRKRGINLLATDTRMYSSKQSTQLSEEEVLEMHLSARKRACNDADRIIESSRSRIIIIEKQTSEKTKENGSSVTGSNVFGSPGFGGSSSASSAVVGSAQPPTLSGDPFSKEKIGMILPVGLFGVPSTSVSSGVSAVEASPAFAPVAQDVKKDIPAFSFGLPSAGGADSGRKTPPTVPEPLGALAQRAMSPPTVLTPSMAVKPPPSPSGPTRKAPTPPLGIAFSESSRKESADAPQPSFVFLQNTVKSALDASKSEAPGTSTSGSSANALGKDGAAFSFPFGPAAGAAVPAAPVPFAPSAPVVNTGTSTAFSFPGPSTAGAAQVVSATPAAAILPAATGIFGGTGDFRGFGAPVPAAAPSFSAEGFASSKSTPPFTFGGPQPSFQAPAPATTAPAAAPFQFGAAPLPVAPLAHSQPFSMFGPSGTLAPSTSAGGLFGGSSFSVGGGSAGGVGPSSNPFAPVATVGRSKKNIGKRK